MRFAARFSLLALPVWLALAGPGCRVLPKGPPGELLREGKQHAAAGEMKDAARHFRAVKVRHPDSEEAEEATFLQAEAHRRLKEGQRAFTVYKEFVETYPNSRYSLGVADGEYKLADDYFEGRIPGFLFFKSDGGYGVRILDHMQIHFRNHSLADDALLRMGEWQLDRENYEEAADSLRRLLQEYPRSVHGVRARYQLARALWRQSEGAPYDERILLQSRRGFTDFIGTARLKGDAERLAKPIAAAERMIVRINERLARKQYLIGRFYERTGHPKSAVIYYDYCLRTYPGTKGATDCAARRKRLAGEGAAS